jgi:hypothetical protein
MNNMAEQIYEEVRALPESDVREVLDFVGYLKSKHQTAAVVDDAAADWAEFESLAGAWSGKFNRDECYDRKVLR